MSRPKAVLVEIQILMAKTNKIVPQWKQTMLCFETLHRFHNNVFQYLLHQSCSKKLSDKENLTPKDYSYQLKILEKDKAEKRKQQLKNTNTIPLIKKAYEKDNYDNVEFVVNTIRDSSNPHLHLS